MTTQKRRVGRAREVSASDIKRWIKELRNGATYAEVAERAGFSISTVRNYTHETIGVRKVGSGPQSATGPRGPRPHTAQRIKKWAAAVRVGSTYAEIARKEGVTVEYVGQLMRPIFGTRKKSPPCDEKTRDAIIRSIHKGGGRRQIAERYGVRPCVVDWQRRRIVHNA